MYWNGTFSDFINKESITFIYNLVQAPYFMIDGKQSVNGPSLLVALLIKTYREKKYLLAKKSTRFPPQ